VRPRHSWHVLSHHRPRRLENKRDHRKRERRLKAQSVLPRSPYAGGGGMLGKQGKYERLGEDEEGDWGGSGSGGMEMGRVVVKDTYR